ncbi:hypothetical protein CHUAL_005245 [Chamberlinius hualienensis]
MKFVCFSLAVLFVVSNIYCDSDFCFGPHDDHSCASDECCAKSYWNHAFICKDRGDDIGDSCGGTYNCGCIDGLICVRHTSIIRKLKQGYGTCQQPRTSRLPNSKIAQS